MAVDRTLTPTPAEISENDFAKGAVTARTIGEDSVRAEDISQGSLTADNLERLGEGKFTDSSVENAPIRDNSLAGEHLADGCVQTRHMAANSVLGRNIRDGVIESSKINRGGIITQHIENGTLQSKDFAYSSVYYNHIYSVGVEKIINLTEIIGIGGFRNDVATRNDTLQEWRSVAGRWEKILSTPVTLRANETFNIDAGKNLDHYAQVFVNMRDPAVTDVMIPDVLIARQPHLDSNDQTQHLQNHLFRTTFIGVTTDQYSFHSQFAGFRAVSENSFETQVADTASGLFTIEEMWGELTPDRSAAAVAPEGGGPTLEEIIEKIIKDLLDPDPNPAPPPYQPPPPPLPPVTGPTLPPDPAPPPVPTPPPVTPPPGGPGLTPEPNPPPYVPTPPPTPPPTLPPVTPPPGGPGVTPEPNPPPYIPPPPPAPPPTPTPTPTPPIDPTPPPDPPAPPYVPPGFVTPPKSGPFPPTDPRSPDYQVTQPVTKPTYEIQPDGSIIVRRPSPETTFINEDGTETVVSPGGEDRTFLDKEFVDSVGGPGNAIQISKDWEKFMRTVTEVGLAAIIGQAVRAPGLAERIDDNISDSFRNFYEQVVKQRVKPDLLKGGIKDALVGFLPTLVRETFLDEEDEEDEPDVVDRRPQIEIPSGIPPVIPDLYSPAVTPPHHYEQGGWYGNYRPGQ